jgi:glycerol-3-phosphate acyltransferase PlsX
MGLFPSVRGRVVVLDVGTNVDCKPEHLHQFAIMGATYARRILNVESPAVGLLNVGEEPGKGNALSREAFALLKADPGLNFVGNVEGRDILAHAADVIVCDGFVGNVVLKTAEGLYEVLSDRLKGLFSALEGAPGTGGVSDAVRTFRRNMDYAEQGGAPLLGINGIVMISHGRSDARAIRNALLGAAGVHRRGVLAAMIQGLATGNSRSHS